MRSTYIDDPKGMKMQGYSADDITKQKGGVLKVRISESTVPVIFVFYKSYYGEII